MTTIIIALSVGAVFGLVLVAMVALYAGYKIHCDKQSEIKSVVSIPLELTPGQYIEGPRLHKIYTIKVTPQTTGSFEMDDSKSVTVTVTSGSKREAHHTLSMHICNEDSVVVDDPLNNNSTCGDFFKGNACALEILGYHKYIGSPSEQRLSEWLTRRPG